MNASKILTLSSLSLLWAAVPIAAQGLAAELAAAPPRADCMFDGSCAPRPDAPAPAVVAGGGGGTKSPSRLGGLEKGASEGALLGFYTGISPALTMLDAGFGRSLSRASDGPRSDNGNGGLYYYGGMALAAILYIPALILGGIGGLFGGAAGAAAPKEAAKWDAERLLFDKRR